MRLSGTVLLFTVAATMLAGVLFGCVPAWQAARINLNEVLKEGGRSAVSAGRGGLRRSLVILEFALALSLLAGGGLALRSLWNVAHVDLGFRTDHILTFTLPEPQGHLTDPQQITIFYRQLLEKIEALPGVSAASASVGMPVGRRGFRHAFSNCRKARDRRPFRASQRGLRHGQPRVFPNFWDTAWTADVPSPSMIRLAVFRWPSSTKRLQQIFRGRRSSKANHHRGAVNSGSHQARAAHSLADRRRLPRRPQPGPARRRFPRNRRALRSKSLAASDHRGTRVRSSRLA